MQTVPLLGTLYARSLTDFILFYHPLGLRCDIKSLYSQIEKNTIELACRRVYVTSKKKATVSSL